MATKNEKCLTHDAVLCAIKPSPSCQFSKKKKKKKRAYRVWWCPQVPMQSFFREVPTLEEAKRLVDTLAAYDLFQFENRVKPDYANVGGIQQWIDVGGYMDWEDIDDMELEESHGNHKDDR